MANDSLFARQAFAQGSVPQLLSEPSTNAGRFHPVVKTVAPSSGKLDPAARSHVLVWGGGSRSASAARVRRLACATRFPVPTGRSEPQRSGDDDAGEAAKVGIGGHELGLADPSRSIENRVGTEQAMVETGICGGQGDGLVHRDDAAV